jgi:hypothetical protein
MSQIIAARFTTFALADSARHRLLVKGFVDEDLAEFYVNPSGQHDRFPVGGDEYADPQARPAGLGAAGGVAIGACVGMLLAGIVTLAFFHSVLVLIVATAVGAYVGSLAGAMLMTRGGGRTQESVMATRPHERESGVLLAVHVNPDERLQAVDILREAHGEDIEEASGRWQHGQWADFDPTRWVRPVA